jgi:hypothetical protein
MLVFGSSGIYNLTIPTTGPKAMNREYAFLSVSVTTLSYGVATCQAWKAHA